MNDNPIFIVGGHKSGTSLLRSLLNGTPELFVVPIEAHFFQLTGFWVDYGLRRNMPRKQTLAQTVAALVQHVQRSNAVAAQTSDSVLVGRWNIDAFRDFLLENAAEDFRAGNWRGFFDAYIAALHVGLYGGPPTTNRFAEKTVENAEYASVLQTLYPDARFIHIVRNPYANLVSLRRYIARNKSYPILNRSLSTLYNVYYYLYKNPLHLSNYLVIRYEDLIQDPAATMQQVAQHVDIPFRQALLTPTMLDEPWVGNSTSGEAFSGISTRPLTDWQQHIHPLEITFVNRLFTPILRDFHYEIITTPGSIYRPAPHEGVLVYFFNRLLWTFTKKSVFFPI